MKFVHTALLLFFLINTLHSQTLEVAPAQGNPVLRSFAAQQEAQAALIVEQLTGNLPTGNRSAVCPPDLEGNYVTSGETIEIKLDTFGLMDGEEDATITIENSGTLQFGTGLLDTLEPILIYSATAGLTGYATETVQLKLSQPGHDTLFQVEINVRRKGRVVVTQSQTVQPESITTFCLDSELDFLKPKYCSNSYDCPDNYDGQGFTIWHLSSYDYPDTCLVYYASRFPGVDTVCMNICDEWGVCDEFKVPYIIPGDTLSIANQPFFDDFSAYDGPYPSPDFWLDKNVYRNTTLAKNPPSVGLVTFDGLNHRGRVYNISQGVGDRLTSKPIDLSPYSANSNVFLRFFLAPKGYGLPPDIIDNMVLEFRNADREWVTAGTYQGIGNVPLDSFPPFLFYAIKVDDPQFFHDAFQFRFSARVSPGGVVDLWHLDYVHLGRNESTSNNFNDVAFTKLPTSILKNYTSMPYRHFKGHVADEVQGELLSNFYNHFEEIRNLGDSKVTFRETTTNTDIGSVFTVVASGPDNNMDPKTPIERLRNVPQAIYDNSISGLEGIPVADFRNLSTTYTLTLDAQSDLYKTNDTVTINNPFSNYFAHDDGTAEWQVYIAHSTGEGQQIASQFHANVADTLKAVQIMFPHVNGDVQSQLFNLKVWVGSLDTDPVFVRPLLKPLYPSSVYDSLQGFTTYVLDNFAGELTPVGIPAGDFFVGIEQATATTLGIPIGFDVQNQCNCTWSNLEGDEWGLFPESIGGALMIRPVFGETQSTSGTDDAPIIGQGVEIYPNPTTGRLNFQLATGTYQDYQVAVFNNLGQQLQQDKLSESLDLSHLSNGIYFLRILDKKTGALFSKRIVLAKD